MTSSSNDIYPRGRSDSGPGVSIFMPLTPGQAFGTFET